MVSTRLRCRILALFVACLLVVGGAVCPVLASGKGGSAPLIAASAIASVLVLPFGLGLLLAALVPIEGYWPGQVAEELEEIRKLIDEAEGER